MSIMNCLNLIALNSMGEAIIEEAMSTGKKSKQQRQRQYHIQTQVAMKNFPENQDTLQKPNYYVWKFNEQK